MSGNQQVSGPQYTRRERPWLLPYNRRLRHLQGITIRNATIPHDITGRPRGKTIDDDAIPQSLRSPAKILAQKETKELAHAQSSSDLRSISESTAITDSTNTRSLSEAETSSPKKPRLKPIRRRSTMEWTNASLVARQKKLEDVAAVKMLDVLFSIHIVGEDEPIYVSEVSRKTVNPSFRFFDLQSCGPFVTRQDQMTVKLFAKDQTMPDYRYSLEFRVGLPALQFIGKSLESFHHPLPENAVLFHMTDGIYTSLTNLPATASQFDLAETAPRSSVNNVLPISSYDALMRLATLDTCIQDALHTREKLSAQISELLQLNRVSLSKTEQVPEARVSESRTLSAANVQRKRVENAARKRDDLKDSILDRRSTMQQGRKAQSHAATDMEAAQGPLKERRAQGHQTLEEMIGQRRRCCEELQSIYPIEPISGRSLSFTIRGLPLPNSHFDDCDELATAAALGYVAHAVYLLSFYLSSPLPYPITPYGSTSTINDPISQTLTQGSPSYPLFMKGVVRYRFEYGVFLLNKDIEIMACQLGLKIIDIRQTLPNLKYLLYIATSGKGDLPARKAGGIRALLMRRGEGSGATTPTLSRVGSDDGSEAGSDRGRVHSNPAAEAFKSKLLERSLAPAANSRTIRGKSPTHTGMSRLKDVSQ